MTKHLLWAIILFIIASPLFSQPLVFDYLSQDKKITGSVKTFFAEDKQNKTLTISLHNNNQIKRFLYVNETIYKKELIQFTEGNESPVEGFLSDGKLDNEVNNIYKNKEFIGGYRLETDLTEVFFEKKGNKYFFIGTDFQTGQTQIKDTVLINAKEHLLVTFFRENQFWVTTYLPKKNELYFYITSLGKETIRKVLEIDLKDKIKATSKFAKGETLSLKELLKSKDLTILENGKEYPYFMTAPARKLYVYPDELVFTINSYDYYTHTLSINLDSLSFTVNSFDLITTLENKYDTDLYSSSCLINGYLITMNPVKDNKVRINIFDKNSQTLLKTEILDDRIIKERATTPIIKVGNFSNDEVKSNTNIATFLKRVPMPSLSPKQKKGFLVLNIGGSYDRFSSAQLVLTVADIGLSIGFWAITNVNLSWFSIMSIPSNENLNNTISFQTAFELNTFTLTKTLPESNIAEQLIEFGKSHSHSLKEQKAIYFNGAYYLCAITEDRMRLIMHKF